MRVQIHELRVQVHELWVQIHNSRYQIQELRVQIHELRVQIYELWVQIHGLGDFSFISLTQTLCCAFKSLLPGTVNFSTSVPFASAS